MVKLLRVENVYLLTTQKGIITWGYISKETPIKIRQPLRL